jgi:hypothetical protein
VKVVGPVKPTVALSSATTTLVPKLLVVVPSPTVKETG